MKLIDGRKVEYASDDEFYTRQASGARPHDKDRFVQARLRHALRFLMLGGSLEHSTPAVTRENPRFNAKAAFLDVGCREGWSLSYLNQGCPLGFPWPGRTRFTNTLGMELCHETVAYANSKGRNVIQGDIRKDCLDENRFDVIFTRHCLEHLDTPLDALKNIAKMLKPGGTLLAIVPLESDDIQTEKSRHSWQFRTPDDLKILVQNAGLTVKQNFQLESYTVARRKYWYQLKARQRTHGPELWVLAKK